MREARSVRNRESAPPSNPPFSSTRRCRMLPHGRLQQSGTGLQSVKVQQRLASLKSIFSRHDATSSLSAIAPCIPAHGSCRLCAEGAAARFEFDPDTPIVSGSIWLDGTGDLFFWSACPCFQTSGSSQRSFAIREVMNRNFEHRLTRSYEGRYSALSARRSPFQPFMGQPILSPCRGPQYHGCNWF